LLLPKGGREKPRSQPSYNVSRLRHLNFISRFESVARGYRSWNEGKEPTMIEHLMCANTMRNTFNFSCHPKPAMVSFGFSFEIRES
jgi:hypothetical protein